MFFCSSIGFIKIPWLYLVVPNDNGGNGILYQNRSNKVNRLVWVTSNFNCMHGDAVQLIYHATKFFQCDCKDNVWHCASFNFELVSCLSNITILFYLSGLLSLLLLVGLLGVGIWMNYVSPTVRNHFPYCFLFLLFIWVHRTQTLFDQIGLKFRWKKTLHKFGNFEQKKFLRTLLLIPQKLQGDS